MTTITLARGLGIGIVMIFLGLVSLLALDYGPYPTYPIHILIVAFLAYPLAWQLAALFVPVLFLFWSFFLARGESEIPRRSVWLLTILVAGSVLNFASAWHDGLRFSSRSHFISLILLNVVMIIPISISDFWVASGRRSS